MNQKKDIAKIRRLVSKFQPPMLNMEDFVYRKELIENELNGDTPYKFTFIEAQAGQGKTITALQFVEKIKNRYVWFQVEEEDRDPFYFLLSLVEIIEMNIVGTQLGSGKMLRNGEIPQSDVLSAVNQLMNELETLSVSPFSIIFDDIHLLVDAVDVLSILDELFERSIEPVSFLLLSRSLIPFKSKKLKFGGSTLYLTNNDLAFSRHEAVLLFSKREKGNSQTLYEKASILHRDTEGWVTGMILGEKSIGLEKGLFQSRTANLKNIDKLDQYFRKEILNSLPEDIRTQLVRLSLLDDLPAPLVVEITGDDEFSYKLYSLMDNNSFIRLLDIEVETFTFHHLMRESLRLEALFSLTTKVVNEILRTAISYHISLQEIEKSVIYTLRLGDLEDVEKILERHGLELVGKNRHATLQRIPHEIAKSDREKSGWIQLFEGILLTEKDPQKSLVHLINAEDIFQQKKCMHGRVIARSQLVYHYILTALGSTEDCESYLKEIQQDLQKIEETLSLYTKVFIYRDIGAGYTVFNADFKKSRQYLSKAIACAEQANLSVMQISSLTFLGYSYLISSDYHSTMTVAESLYKLKLSRDIGIASTVLIHHFLTDILEILDDYPNYLRQRTNYFQGAGRDILHKNHFGPSVILWDIKLLIARGQFQEAKSLIEDGLNKGTVFASPHIRSRYIEYKAYLAGLSQDSETNIEDCLNEAQKLRKMSSWKGFFHVRNILFAGITNALIERFECAERFLQQGISQATVMGLKGLLASGHIFRAYTRMANSTEAFEDISLGLTLMRSHGIDMFWGWNSKIVKPVLIAAVENNIKSNFAKTLLRKRMHCGVTVDKRIVPLLEISYLNNLNFTIENRILRVDLTPKQRDLFGVIISTPSLKISQEKLREEIWPDVSLENARRNFDTLISRLRTSLRPLVKPHNINDYLVIAKGIVSLQNCRVDTHNFLRNYEEGVTFVNAEKWWQAGNSFYLANQLWPERGVLFTPNCDTLCYYLDHLKTTYLNLAEMWSKILIESDDTSLARRVLETAWIQAPDNRRITSLFYSHLIKESEPAKASSVLSGYKKALEKREVLPIEIEKLIAELLVL